MWKVYESCTKVMFFIQNRYPDGFFCIFLSLFFLRGPRRRPAGKAQSPVQRRPILLRPPRNTIQKPRPNRPSINPIHTKQLYYIYFPYYIVYDFTRTPQPAYSATATACILRHSPPRNRIYSPIGRFHIPAVGKHMSAATESHTRQDRRPPSGACPTGKASVRQKFLNGRSGDIRHQLHETLSIQ